MRWATMALLRAERGFHAVASTGAMTQLASVIAAHLRRATALRAAG